VNEDARNHKPQIHQIGIWLLFTKQGLYVKWERFAHVSEYCTA